MLVFVGWREAALLSVGTGVVASTAWWPKSVVRVVGSLLLALVVWIFARTTLGDAPATLGVLAVAGLSWRFLPHRVQRRVCFMIPSLVLLVFVTSMLMYLAPGNPFA